MYSSLDTDHFCPMTLKALGPMESKGHRLQKVCLLVVISRPATSTWRSYSPAIHMPVSRKAGGVFLAVGSGILRVLGCSAASESTIMLNWSQNYQHTKPSVTGNLSSATSPLIIQPTSVFRRSPSSLCTHSPSSASRDVPVRVLCYTEMLMIQAVVLDDLPEFPNPQQLEESD